MLGEINPVQLPPKPPKGDIYVVAVELRNIAGRKFVASGICRYPIDHLVNDTDGAGGFSTLKSARQMSQAIFNQTGAVDTIGDHNKIETIGHARAIISRILN